MAAAPRAAASLALLDGAGSAAVGVSCPPATGACASGSGLGGGRGAYGETARPRAEPGT